MFTRFLFLASLLVGPLSAAEPYLRIPMTIVQVTKPAAGPETKIVVATPVVTVESGKTIAVEAGSLVLTLLPSLDKENRVQLSVVKRIPLPSASYQTTIKLGEKGNLHADDYELELFPSLVTVGINIQFAGGTLEQLLTQLTENGKKPFNLLADKVYLTCTVPAFTVHNANALDFAQALSFLLSGQDLVVSATPGDDQFQAIFFIRPKEGKSSSSGFASYNLIPYLERTTNPGGNGHRSKTYTPDEIIKILTDACEFQSGHPINDELKFRFHPQTKLLFITGQPDLVRIASVTLDALPKPERLY